MYYEINIAKNSKTGYYHLFATHKRSCTSIFDTKAVLSVILEKFPSPEYKVSVTKYEETGYSMDIDDVKDLEKLLK